MTDLAVVRGDPCSLTREDLSTGRFADPPHLPEPERLRAPASFSRAAVLKAIRARSGLEPWEDRLDHITPDRSRTEVQVLGSARK